MLVILNVIFGTGGIVGFTIASWYGPVAVVMPIVTASKLVSNMAKQIFFELSDYDKSMRVGTWILCCAAACLPQTGPTEPISVDIAQNLSTTQAQIWLGFLVLALGACIFDYHYFKDERRTMFTLAAIVAVSTTLGANVAKILGIAHGEGLKISFFLGLLCAFFSFAYNYVASVHCELAVYIPLSESVQLVVNAFTGIMVWGDLQRIPDLLTYSMIYGLTILGVYELSAYDLFGITILVGGNRVSQQAVRSYATLIAECQETSQVREDISATHLLEAMSYLLRGSIERGEMNKPEMIDMIKQYNSMKKTETAAERFKEEGQKRHIRRQETIKGAAVKFKKSVTLREPLVGPQASNEP